MRAWGSQVEDDARGAGRRAHLQHGVALHVSSGRRQLREVNLKAAPCVHEHDGPRVSAGELADCETRASGTATHLTHGDVEADISHESCLKENAVGPSTATFASESQHDQWTNLSLIRPDPP